MPMNDKPHKPYTEEQLEAELKQTFSTLRLPPETREQTRAFLREYVQLRPLREPARTETSSGWFIRVTQLTVSYIRPVPALAALLVFFVSGSTALAAEGALPGDTLYPIKVSVNEQFRSALAFSTEAQGAWEVERTERRLEEASRLAAADALDETKRAEIETRLEAHTSAAEAAATTLAEQSQVAEAAELESRLAATLAVHGEALRSIRERSSRLVRAQVDAVLERIGGTTAVLAVAPATAPMALDSNTNEEAGFATMSMRAEVEVDADARSTTALAEPPAPDEATAKMTTAVSAVSERTVERLQKAAGERIESAEKEFERLREKSRKTAEVAAALERAANVYAEGEASFVDGSLAVAAEQFKAALEAAITAETTLRVYLRLDRFNIELNEDVTDPPVDADPAPDTPETEEPHILPAPSDAEQREPGETDEDSPDEGVESNTGSEVETGSAVNVRIR